MAMTMHVNIVSAEAEIFSGTVEQVFAPAMMGEVGIYPRHTQMLTPLKPGEIRVVKEGGDEEFYFVSGGMLEVQPHMVTVLADTAVRAKDLDEAQAIEAKKRAEQALKDRQGDMDYARAEAELAEAVAQLQTIQRMRRKYDGRRS
ncbi:MAG: F0F1 ATP synthase subunit epsilon [Gammaproteobacteria bacterium]|nr:F0F1 ATP synthase subunit epsilon [Gammaproteobacteria bacterium]MCW8840192.1 F0F1 ATP synthase subunit epsilon [Gammaproteobacteria bacterium]MCW8958056.1 F0F1 ATP synthase subunit epsilon [Gammaproteobacteria bacterium]MCW8992289.1 F0F1 ATP synthase subunit epsilon [Gammaproteobacteria bacterium]MCW9089672.1 F0F1 ATP synthase subunit epsilon [Gammaproteobacteria bacterium]